MSRIIHQHLVAMDLLVDNKNEPILSIQEYLALSSKDRKAHRQFCRKHNVKIPT